MCSFFALIDLYGRFAAIVYPSLPDEQALSPTIGTIISAIKRELRRTREVALLVTVAPVSSQLVRHLPGLVTFDSRFPWGSC